MAKRTAAEIAQMIISADFGDDSDIEGLSGEEDNATSPKNVLNCEEEIESVAAENIISSDDDNFEEPPTKKRKTKAKSKKVTWKKTEFISSAPPKDNDDIPAVEPMSPYFYFEKFITNLFIEEVCEKTNMYHLQNQGKNLKATAQEIEALIGIHIEMGSIKFPQLRLYWSKGRRYKLIANAMTFNRFSMLRNNLHCVDNMQNNEGNNDKFWKVRPIMNQYLYVLLQETPHPEKRLCIDEQMIPFKGRLGLKQYMKGKPNPWGIKMYFLCGESGMPYNFLAYQGKSTNMSEEYSHFGLSGAVVMELAKSRIKPDSNYRLFFDNYFTPPALVQSQHSSGIYCTGTVRSKRVGSLPIKTKSELSKKGRGAMDGCSSSDGEMCVVRWHDNSLVTMLSSAYDWKKNQGHVLRYDKSSKAYTQVPCPSSILQYNRSMGGC